MRLLFEAVDRWVDVFANEIWCVPAIGGTLILRTDAYFFVLIVDGRQHPHN